MLDPKLHAPMGVSQPYAMVDARRSFDFEVAGVTTKKNSGGS